VPPSTASTNFPPTKFLCCETVTLMKASRSKLRPAYRATGC
jgi:hypothetical protein